MCLFRGRMTKVRYGISGLRAHEIRAINDFTKIFYNIKNNKYFETDNLGDILSITIQIYYSKREKHNFKTYNDTIKFLKYSTKFARLKAHTLLTDSANNRNELKTRFIKETIWEMGEEEND